MRINEGKREFQECFGICSYYLFENNFDLSVQFIKDSLNYLTKAYELSNNFMFLHFKIKVILSF
jgi:hypothetical protein